VTTLFASQVQALPKATLLLTTATLLLLAIAKDSSACVPAACNTYVSCLFVQQVHALPKATLLPATAKAPSRHHLNHMCCFCLLLPRI
jgi:hypothetical protein